MKKRDQVLFVMGDIAPLIPMWFWSNNHRRKGQGDKKQVMGNRLWVIGKDSKWVIGFVALLAFVLSIWSV